MPQGKYAFISSDPWKNNKAQVKCDTIMYAGGVFLREQAVAACFMTHRESESVARRYIYLCCRPGSGRCEDLQRRQESRAEQSRAKQSRAEEQRNSMALKIASLLLLALVLCSYASAFTEEAVDCCLTTSNKQIPRKVVKAYREQTTNGGCAIAATQFITVKDKTLCAPPPGRNDWVAKLIRRLKTKGQE
ncbi:uncharacterized protein LOC108938942 isoform X2 [Scleropages formosus]|uniref:uncharacterized protein LOC108938942 isoform X2 n=1 Tax=Scleropages formosus TaxID=113540 RepID=UPI0010FAB4F3|nr:uncharacterized protein LOC108938942 isoform X2 [Scleropages formosus]